MMFVMNSPLLFVIGKSYHVSLKQGVGSEEQGFFISIFKNSDNHGDRGLLPWIMKL